MQTLSFSEPEKPSLPKAKKSFGQNFLIDGSVVNKIVEAADIQKGETVLEIGPGTGLLTDALVRAGARVIAIELDHDLIAPLKEKFGDKIELIEGDVLKMDVSRIISGMINSRDGLDRPLHVHANAFKLVANIPYNITSQIIERFLSHEPRPTRMILMVQKEVADRILAKPPQMSLLSVVSQIYAECSRVTNVKAGSFRPIPKVDSAVVQFDLSLPLRGRVGEGVAHSEQVIHFAKIGFSSPRKQLQNNLSSGLQKTSEEIKTALASLDLNPQIRAESLTIRDWERLEKLFAK